MDLTNQPIIKFAYALDEVGILNITIMDGSDAVLGTMIVENAKYRSLMDALSTMAQERVTSFMPQTGYRVAYEVQSNTAEVTFS